jgi:membrane protease YdiL (CAAX protease family)
MSNTKKADVLFLSMILIHIAVVLGLTVLNRRGIIVNMSTNESLILSQLLILVPVGIYLLISKTNPIKLIRFKRIDIATIGMVILLTALIMPLITFINALSMLFSKNMVMDLSAEMAGNSLLVNLVLMAVIPAISEEFVFRGVLFHTYRKNSILYGAVISGIVFGLMHLNFNQFSYAFILGIVFALIIEATGSIYATMIAHFVINGSSVLSLEAQKLVGIYGGSSKQLALQTQLTPETLMMVAAVYGVVAVGTTALAIGVYIWIAKHCGRENHLRAVFTIRKGEDKFNLRKAISFWLIASIVISIGFMGFSEYMNGRETQPKTIEQDIDGVPDSTLQVLFHE